MYVSRHFWIGPHQSLAYQRCITLLSVVLSFCGSMEYNHGMRNPVQGDSYSRSLYTQTEGHDHVNFEGPWMSSTDHTIVMVCWDLHQSYLLMVGPMQNSGKPYNIICSVLCRNTCRDFIHDNFFGTLGLRLLVWGELGRSRPFRSMRDLRMQWSRAFSLVWSGPHGSQQGSLPMVIFPRLTSWTHIVE